MNQDEWRVEGYRGMDAYVLLSPHRQAVAGSVSDTETYGYEVRIAQEGRPLRYRRYRDPFQWRPRICHAARGRSGGFQCRIRTHRQTLGTGSIDSKVPCG